MEVKLQSDLKTKKGAAVLVCVQKNIKEIRERPDDRYFFIRPYDIAVDRMSATFGKYKIEKAAANLVRFCQQVGGWYPFTAKELEKFYYDDLGENPKTMFFGLLGCRVYYDGGLRSTLHESYPCLVVGNDGMYAVTSHFVERCAGYYREQDVSAGTVKIVLARGRERAHTQKAFFFSISNVAGEKLEDFADRFAVQLSREHGLDEGDGYWVAAISYVEEHPLFRDTRVDPSIATPL